MRSKFHNKICQNFTTKSVLAFFYNHIIVLINIFKTAPYLSTARFWFKSYSKSQYRGRLVIFVGVGVFPICFKTQYPIMGSWPIPMENSISRNGLMTYSNEKSHPKRGLFTLWASYQFVVVVFSMSVKKKSWEEIQGEPDSITRAHTNVVTSYCNMQPNASMSLLFFFTRHMLVCNNNDI